MSYWNWKLRPTDDAQAGEYQPTQKDAEDELGVYAKPTLAETGFRPDKDSLLGRYWNWATGKDTSPLRVANWPGIPERMVRHGAGLVGDQLEQLSPVQPVPDDFASRLKSIDPYSPFQAYNGKPDPNALMKTAGYQTELPPIVKMLAGTTKRFSGALQGETGGYEVNPETGKVALGNSPKPEDAGSVFMAAGLAEPIHAILRKFGLGEEPLGPGESAVGSFSSPRVAEGMAEKNPAMAKLSDPEVRAARVAEGGDPRVESAWGGPRSLALARQALKEGADPAAVWEKHGWARQYEPGHELHNPDALNIAPGQMYMEHGFSENALKGRYVLGIGERRSTPPWKSPGSPEAAWEDPGSVFNKFENLPETPQRAYQIKEPVTPAEQLAQRLRNTEDTYRSQGLTDAQIATRLDSEFGKSVSASPTGVVPEDLRTGRVWWRTSEKASRPQWSDEAVSRLKDKDLAQLSHGDAAEVMGRQFGYPYTADTIRKKRKLLGMSSPVDTNQNLMMSAARRGMDPAMTARFEAMAKKGMSYTDIAKNASSEFGVPVLPNSVSTYLRRKAAKNGGSLFSNPDDPWAFMASTTLRKMGQEDAAPRPSLEKPSLRAMTPYDQFYAEYPNNKDWATGADAERMRSYLHGVADLINHDMPSRAGTPQTLHANASDKPGLLGGAFASPYVNGARKSGVPIPTVKNAQRIAFPGIYERPDLVAERAAANTAPESPWLKKLFGVTREDLAATADRPGNEAPRVNFAPNPRGNASAPNITTPKNTQRLVDTLAEVQKRAPGMYSGMKAWYVMDPAFQRLVKLVGPDEAKKYYNDFNNFTGVHSPGAPVEGELNRGTHALLANTLGRMTDWEKYGGTAAGNRGADFPSWLTDNQGHPYHSESQMSGLKAYLENGNLSSMGSPKVPAYVHASGVPETGFQTTFPVGDAHWARGVGLADVRTNAGFGESAKMPEMQALYPWWRDKVAKAAGLESVPAQAITWGAYGPHTGVATEVGAPKLELLAKRIADTAKRRGLKPADVRDDVLLGKTGVVAPSKGTLFANKVTAPGLFASNFAKLGYPEDIWHHGTTRGGFSVFKDPMDPANHYEPFGNDGVYDVRNHDGPGIYASSSPEDVGRNYYGDGPDVQYKINDMKYALHNQGMSLEDAARAAKAQFSGPEARMLPLRMKLENPAIIDPLKKERGPISSLEALRDHTRDVFKDFKVPSDVASSLVGRAHDLGGTWLDFDNAYRRGYGKDYVQNRGGSIGQAFADIVKKMGHDSIVRHDVDRLFRGMGIPEGTKHLVKFSNKGIRHVEAAYDPAKADSTDILSANASPAALAGTQGGKAGRDPKDVVKWLKGLDINTDKAFGLDKK